MNKLQLNMLKKKLNSCDLFISLLKTLKNRGGNDLFVVQLFSGELMIEESLNEQLSRAILGTLTVEEVYKDRDQFASLVREVAAPDVGR